MECQSRPEAAVEETVSTLGVYGTGPPPALQANARFGRTRANLERARNGAVYDRLARENAVG